MKIKKMFINIQLFAQPTDEDIKGKYADSLKEIEKLKNEKKGLEESLENEKKARATAEKQRDEMFFRIPLVKDNLAKDKGKDSDEDEESFDEAILKLYNKEK